MESSIAEFDERQLACELLPTESRQDQALKLVKCFGHLKRGWERACLAKVFRPLEEGLGVCMSCEPIKEFSGLRIPAS